MGVEKLSEEMLREHERQEEQIERIIAVLERAVALYKENPEKGEVYIVVKDTRKDWEYVTRTKIAEIADGDAISPEGEKIPLWSIEGAAMVDMADEE